MTKAFSYSAEGDLNVVVKNCCVQTASDGAAARVASPSGTRRRHLGGLTSGGTDGNERLTSMAGAILLVLLAVLGITIVQIGQLIWLHLFLGLVLLGPLAVKTASTGYRFVRYYARDPAYRFKGPPEPIMRFSAPMLVASTLVVFISGILLLADGPSSRDQLLALHKVSFIVWLAFTALHVLGHMPGFLGSLGAARVDGELTGRAPGAAGRWITLVGATVAGVVLAIVLIPQFAPWTAHSVFLHHHHPG
jgi:hypothetical protein